MSKHYLILENCNNCYWYDNNDHYCVKLWLRKESNDYCNEYKKKRENCKCFIKEV